jgi:hypothetical protein
MTPGVGARVSRTTRDGWASGGHSSRGINPGRECSLRDTEPGTVVERALEGNRKAQESTGRRVTPAREGARRERTPGGSKAPKRACRSFTGEPRRDKGAAVEVACASGSYAADLAVARNLRHGSCVTGRLHGWARGKESARTGARALDGESGRETPDHDAPATIGSRTRKGEEAQETGHGSSGGESSGGQLQGRERHEIRPRSVGLQNRREGQEP